MRTARWLAFLLMLLSLPAAAAPVVVLELDGVIGPATSAFVERGIRAAEERGAQAVVLRINTPGGLDTSMRDIIRVIIGSPLPVVSYVAPGGSRAASAGTYILYASHVAAMAPGTNLGAATPVQLGGAPGSEPSPEPGGEQEQGRPPQPQSASERKAVNDAVAYIRSLAELRGRNADWAEQAVREAASLGAAQALENDVIDLIADDLDDLLGKLDGRRVTTAQGEVSLATAGAEVVRVEPDWRTRLLAVITDPNVAYILMLVGIYGLIFELANPGSLVPGVLGGICLLLALFAFQALPINYAGLALILLGLAFVVAEAFVSSFGILGIGGVVAFVIGSIMLFDTEAPAFQLSLQLIAGFTVVSVLLLLGLITMLVRARRQPVANAGAGVVGSEGEALHAFSGHGQVRIGGEIWNAYSDAPVDAHQRVRVLARDGLRLRVEPVGPGPAERTGES